MTTNTLCLGVACDRETVCDKCLESHQNYWNRAVEIAIRDAKRVLESHGYTIIPPENNQD